MTILFRPPFEANSLLLEVTEGCSHNRCSFCTMYRDQPFRVLSMEEIQAQIDDYAPVGDRISRVFLENGDAFTLPGSLLIEIATRLRAAFANLETITMYASIKNIRTKTDQELQTLHELGVDELNIGVETGYGPAVERLNKGYDASEAPVQLQRLRQAGIRYGANIILGCAGRDQVRENALATADLLNATQPFLIFTGTIHADPGCSLYEDMQAGRFRENTIGQYLDEEQILLEHLQMEDCYLFGLHPSNVALLRGRLPQDKQGLLHALDIRRSQLADKLDQVPRRMGEGGVML